MEHFAFPGNIDFAADDQGIFIMQGWWLQGWCVYLSMKQCLQSVNHEQFPIQMTQNNKHNKWLEILDFQPKLLYRTPTKIHRERRSRRQQEAARKAQKTSLNSTDKATSSTERPQTCTEAVTKYYNYTGNGADEEREHGLRKAMRRSGNAYWVYSKIIFFNATTGRQPSVSWGRCWLKSEQRSFVIYRKIHMNNTVAIICSKMQNLKQTFQ